MRRPAPLLLLALVLLAGCGDDGAAPVAETPPDGHRGADDRAGRPGRAHGRDRRRDAVHRLAGRRPRGRDADRGDRPRRLPARGGREARQAVRRRADDAGRPGAISANLVLRFTAPGELIGSGHPKDGGSGLPEDLGLIRSGDGGATWESVSLLGEADLHALDVRGDVVAGQPVEEARCSSAPTAGRRSRSARRRRPDRPRPRPGAARADRDHHRRRPVRVERRRRSWRQRDVLTTETHLAWSETGPLYRVDAAGNVSMSGDGGESWKPAGNAGGGPTHGDRRREGRLYVALPGAVIKRSADGGKSFQELATRIDRVQPAGLASASTPAGRGRRSAARARAARPRGTGAGSRPSARG